MLITPIGLSLADGVPTRALKGLAPPAVQSALSRGLRLSQAAGSYSLVIPACPLKGPPRVVIQGTKRRAAPVRPLMIGSFPFSPLLFIIAAVVVAVRLSRRVLLPSCAPLLYHLTSSARRRRS